MEVLRGRVYAYQPTLPPRPGQSTARRVVTVEEMEAVAVAMRAAYDL